MKFSVVVPTLNAGNHWDAFITAIQKQSIQPDSILVIDSSSEDDTVAKSLRAGFCVHSISRSDFNHGGTRQLAIGLLPDADIIIFLTQDALLASFDALKCVLSGFDDPLVGVCYGRQLPRPIAGPIEVHARLFNYPDIARKSSLDDATSIGLKAAFCSNSFCAYRKSTLDQVGGFPLDVILSEDMIVAARMLLAGWKVAYTPDATVYHSHAYTLMQEFRRYFDIGVMHSRESWLLDKFRGPEGEGARFVISEFKYLARYAPLLIPQAQLRTFLKYLGYRLGRNERFLNIRVKKRLSMHSFYWV